MLGHMFIPIVPASLFTSPPFPPSGLDLAVKYKVTLIIANKHVLGTELCALLLPFTGINVIITPSIEPRNAGSYWKLNYLPMTTQSVNDKT